MGRAVVALLVVCACGSTASEPVSVSVWEDPGGSLTIDQVAAAPFAPPRDPRLRFGFTRSAYWLRIPARPAGGVLLIGYAQLDEVDAYLPDAAAPGGWRVVRTGDRRPAGQRDLHHPQFAFRLPDGGGTAYLRVRTGGALSVPVSLHGRDDFLRAAGDEQLAWGLYYAFLAAMALYNLLLYTVVRERAYLYYVGYLATFVLFQASWAGHASLYLWPDLPAWGSAATSTFVSLSIAGALLFVRRMVNVREVVPRLDRPMAIGAAVFAAAPLLLLAHFSAGVRVIVALATVAVLFFPIPIFLAFRRGYRPARWVLIAYGAILPGGVLFTLQFAGVLPRSFLTEHLLDVGTAAESMLLSFALADRINLLQRERAEAQARLIGGQDEERRRIAAELHDGLGQSLLVLVQRLARESSPLADQAKGLVADVRRVSHDLHPDVLDRLGLAAALRAAAEETLVGIDLTCRIDPLDGLLPRAAELHLYRIAQEALANVVRHAGARNVAVSLLRDGRSLALTVQDDGRGLQAGAPPGLGLSGMRERARLLGGEVAIGAAPAGGVRVRVLVPCERAA